MASAQSSSIGLQEVFKVSGIPTHTFVEPRRFPEIVLNLRSPGRCLVVEGPSGIGKTTAVEKAIESTGLDSRVTKLSARRPQDVEYIDALPAMGNVGTVIVDDYHRLSNSTKRALADYLKALADAEDELNKIVILGINRAGDTLIKFSPDLVNRIDAVRFETEPDEKIQELLAKGESALNVQINVASEIVEAVSGSFYLAQMLAREVCINSRIMEQQSTSKSTDVSFEAVKANVWDRLGQSFRERSKDFCRGTKLRREGRAPYLHILYWLANSEAWTLNVRDAIRNNPNLRGSVGQVVDKGFLSNLIENNQEIRDVVYFDPDSEQLTVEDPQYLFFIRGIPWRQFAQEIGFLSVEFDRRYDFALSFAGSDREVAEALFQQLAQNEVEVFYDKNEQHRILAEDVEEYLRPIYQSEAKFVVVLLGKDYPTRVWTKIESDAFRSRISDGSVIPIWFSDAPTSLFDVTRTRGGLGYDRDEPMPSQVESLAQALLGKLSESR